MMKKTKYFKNFIKYSYQERRRDWPKDVSATINHPLNGANASRILILFDESEVNIQITYALSLWKSVFEYV